MVGRRMNLSKAQPNRFTRINWIVSINQFSNQIQVWNFHDTDAYLLIWIPNVLAKIFTVFNDVMNCMILIQKILDSFGSVMAEEAIADIHPDLITNVKVGANNGGILFFRNHWNHSFRVFWNYFIASVMFHFGKVITRHFHDMKSIFICGKIRNEFFGPMNNKIANGAIMIIVWLFKLFHLFLWRRRSRRFHFFGCNMRSRYHRKKNWYWWCSCN